MSKVEYICFVKLKLGPIGVGKKVVPIAKFIALMISVWTGFSLYEGLIFEEVTTWRGTIFTQLDNTLGYWIRIGLYGVLCLFGLFYSLIGIVDGDRMKDIKERIGPPPQN
ncbi:TPA: hypothetical protein NGU80_003629 [Vibrio parahaemolyticus]|nr:hypothetical protein [Vibrio parahaemolyticus]HCG9871323.1 hypothetical protein [Vibrio parahaemolyticus]